jgi:hypothetical protein
MASSAPTFLSLPREIRDLVYRHLTHSVRLPWTPTQDNWTVSWPLAPTTVVFENAPLPHVLRINSQTSLEYKASDCFAHLSASTDATDEGADFAEAYLIPPAARQGIQELAARQESASSVAAVIRLGRKRAEKKRARALAYQLSQQPYWLRCALSRVKHLAVYKDGMMSDHRHRLFAFVDEITKMGPGLLSVKIALQMVNLIDKLWHLELL